MQTITTTTCVWVCRSVSRESNTSVTLSCSTFHLFLTLTKVAKMKVGPYKHLNPLFANSFLPCAPLRYVFLYTQFFINSLQIERGFLLDASSRNRLKVMLPQLMNDLNTYKEAKISIADPSLASLPAFASSPNAALAAAYPNECIHLRVIPLFANPSEINQYDVPIPTRNIKQVLASSKNEEEWDLTLQQVIPLINGISSVRQIASKAAVHIELVKRSLRHLLYFDCIKMIDVFQYSNMYRIASQEQLLQLLKNPNVQQECASSVPKSATPTSLYKENNNNSHASNSNSSVDGNNLAEVNNNTSQQQQFNYHQYPYQYHQYHQHQHQHQHHHHQQFQQFPAQYNQLLVMQQQQQMHQLQRQQSALLASIREVVQIYSKMKVGVRLSDIVDPESNKYINHRALIAYGLMKGIIARVHEYPILEHTKGGAEEHQTSSSMSISPRGKPNFTEQLRQLMDGSHCMDELCCEFGVSRKDILHRIDSNVRIIYY